MQRYKTKKTSNDSIVKILPNDEEEMVDEHNFVRDLKSRTAKDIVMVYTDGSSGRYGSGGGYAGVILKGNKVFDCKGEDDLDGYFGPELEYVIGGQKKCAKIDLVNKNFPALMELSAVVYTLKQVKKNSHVHLMTDNAGYVLYNMSNIDLVVEKEKKRQNCEAVSLWSELKSVLKEKKLDLTIQHIYGHRGFAGNELADKLAKFGANNFGIKTKNSTVHMTNNEIDLNFAHTFEIKIDETTLYKEQIQNRLNGVSRDLQGAMIKGGSVVTTFKKRKNGKSYISIKSNGTIIEGKTTTAMLRYGKLLNRITNRYGKIEEVDKIQLFNELFRDHLKACPLKSHIKSTNKEKNKRVKYINENGILVKSNLAESKLRFEEKLKPERKFDIGINLS
jgi:ribonuclease HI